MEAEQVRITGGPHAGETGTVVPWPGDAPGPGERFVSFKLPSGEIATVHKSLAKPAGEPGVKPPRPWKDPPVAPNKPKVADLKPRGVKRQWWLMPLDALREAGGDSSGSHPVSRYCLVGYLARYQDRPSENSAAHLAGNLIGALAQQQGTNIEGALDLVVQVFEHGARKYSPDNWRGAASDRESFRHEYLSAICRHVFAPDGEIDPDFGLPHLAHACCGALMVLWHEMRTFS